MRDKEFPRQPQAKRVIHHQTSLTMNVEGTFLSGKEKAISGSKKLMKKNFHWSKQTHSKSSRSITYKASSTTKKDKCSNINHIHKN